MDPILAQATTTLAAQAGEIVTTEAESFLSKVLGEPATALGGLLADKINARRHRNLIAVVVQAKERLKKAGVEPRAVPLKIIHPLLESAALEDETDLQVLWANLLSNAADPGHPASVKPIFISMLGEITSPEARFLNAFYEERNKTKRSKMSGPIVNQLEISASKGELLEIARDCGLITADQDLTLAMKSLHTLLDTLGRNGILKEETRVLPFKLSRSQLDSGPYEEADSVYIDTDQEYRLTELGSAFLNACRPPK